MMKIWETLLVISAIGLGGCGSPGNPQTGAQTTPQNRQQSSGRPGVDRPVGSYSSSYTTPTNARLDLADLANVDLKVVTLGESKEDGVAKKTFTTNSSYKLIEVKDGSATLWKAEENEHANSVVVHFDAEGKPSLATIQLTKADGKNVLRRFVKQDGGEWKTVEKNDYDAKLNGLKGGHTGDTDTPGHDTPAANQGDKEQVTPHPNGKSGSLHGTKKEEPDEKAGPSVQHIPASGPNHLVESKPLDSKPTTPAGPQKPVDKPAGLTQPMATTVTAPHNVQHAGPSGQPYNQGSEPQGAPQVPAWPNGGHDLGTAQSAGPQEATATPVTSPTARSSVLTKQADATTGSPSILDLKTPDPSTFKSLDVNINSVPARVFVMHPGVSVTEVKHDGKEVWKKQLRESSSYCVAFLKNGSPAVTAIMIDTGRTSFQGNRELKGDKWQLLADAGTSTKMNELKTQNEAVKKFSLDLSITTRDTNECKVTNESKDGVTTRLYLPKNGHAIEKVVEGDKELWKSTDGKLCFLCESHSKNGITLLRVHLESNYQLSFSCHKKENNQWKSITGKSLNNELVKWSGGSSSRA